MKVTKVISLLMASLIFLNLGACNKGDGYLEVVQIEIASYKQECIGFVQRLCLLGKYPGDESFNRVYDGINEFQFRWGINSDITIGIRQLDEAYSADGSSLSYHLISIDDQWEDSIGTEYMFNNVRLFELTLTEEDGQSRFLGKEYRCGENVDCDALVQLNNSGGTVNLTFKYLGEEQIELIYWE